MSEVLVMGTETEYGVYYQMADTNIRPTFFSFLNGSKMRQLGQRFDSQNFCIWLLNGGRFYLDVQETPEYCTPEVTSALDLVRWEKAGELVLQNLGELNNRNRQRILVVKHCRGHGWNSEDSDVFSGHHENYGLKTPDHFMQRIFGGTNSLVTFLVSRVIINGAGSFVPSLVGRHHSFKISSRAAAITMLSGAGTTTNRGIINTRSESHSDLLNLRRLHLIVGDANMSEFSIFLTLGTTALVLRMMLESDLLADAPRLLNPVSALHQFSSDFNLQSQVLCHHGEEVTALQLQNYFWRKAVDFASAHLVTAVEERVIQEWGGVLEKLAQDPRLLKGVLDWPTVLCLIERLMEAKGYRWEDFQKYEEGGLTARGSGEIKELIVQCSALDLAYRYITEDGLYNRLVKKGKIKRLLTDGQIAQAVLEPPQDTRARVRGEIISWLIRHCQLPDDWAILCLNWGRAEFCQRGNEKQYLCFLLDDPLDFLCQKWQAFKEVYP